MTQRLTDDEIAKLRERTRIDAASHLHLVARDAITALLDEIEERRRIDARRLAASTMLEVKAITALADHRATPAPN